jgi:hypothetical protein
MVFALPPMIFDLNSKPPDQGEAFTNMDKKPPEKLPLPFDGALPNLNEEPPEEEQLVGGEVPGGRNEGGSSSKFFHDFISIIVTSTTMKLAIYICAFITAVHAEDEHQTIGEAIPDLNMRPPDDEHQAIGEAIPDLNMRPTDDAHQAIGDAIPDLNMQPTYDEHQADADAIPDLNVQPTDIEQQANEGVAFAVPDEQDEYEQMQESMITKLCCSSLLFIIMHNYLDSVRLHRGHT